MHCGERIQFSNEMLSLLLIMISTSGTDGRVHLGESLVACADDEVANSYSWDIL